ncbi:flagellar biosynthesis protein FlhB [Enterobacteriaceae bacterium LUAb1]
MSASTGDKSEKPTSGKLRKARKKGDIPRSKDITMATVLLTSFITIGSFFPYYQSLIKAAFIAMNQMATRLDDEGALHQFMLTSVLIILKFIATLLPIPCAAIVASMVPGGWVFVPGRIKPDIKKLSPISGLKRLFSGQHYMEVMKMIIKCSLLLGMLWWVIDTDLPHLMALQSLFLPQAVTHGLENYYRTIRLFIGAIVLFALIDIPLTRFFFTKKMKMTKKEVKDEYKNQEGNPQIKGRIRQLQQQMAMGQINKQVPHADVVITNPTHFAVALKYDPQKAAAPYIVAKGLDEMALYIRSVATKHHVEIVEFPPLARAVYHSTRVNQQIPASLFRAMAQVLTYVMQLQSWRTDRAMEKPTLNTQVPLPKEVIKNYG